MIMNLYGTVFYDYFGYHSVIFEASYLVDGGIDAVAGVGAGLALDAQQFDVLLAQHQEAKVARVETLHALQRLRGCHGNKRRVIHSVSTVGLQLNPQTRRVSVRDRAPSLSLSDLTR